MFATSSSSIQTYLEAGLAVHNRSNTLQVVTANYAAAQGDAAVKGIDRATSEQLSGLVTALHARANGQAEALSAEARGTVLLAVGAMLAVPLTLICMTLYAGIMPQTKIQPNLPG